jgi:hypothetical protein
MTPPQNIPIPNFELHMTLLYQILTVLVSRFFLTLSRASLFRLICLTFATSGLVIILHRAFLSIMDFDLQDVPPGAQSEGG